MFEWAHLYVWQALIMLDVLIVWLVWVRTLPSDRVAPRTGRRGGLTRWRSAARPASSSKVARVAAALRSCVWYFGAPAAARGR